MKNIRKVLFLLCIVISTTVSAQMTINQSTGMTVKALIEQYFLGSGVRIDATHPILLNGQSSISSNQIGTFTNVDTAYAGRNVPIKEGIILATTGVDQITNSYMEQTATSPTSDFATYAPMLRLDYIAYCTEHNYTVDAMNEIVTLDFWVIPSSFEMSFKYSFGSEEYPQYVHSRYNDFFGLYVDGPYDSEGNLYYGGEQYSHVNIATLPGTGEEGIPGSGTKVCINNVNNGQTEGVEADNPQFFIDNRHDVCTTTGLGGYTRRLTTETVSAVPCKSYHIQISICNISDNALQSAIFLEKGSFNSDMIVIDHSSTKGNYNPDTNAITTYIKGCAHDTMLFRANYRATADEGPYYFTVKPSEHSSLTKGVDYDYYLEDGTPIDDHVTIPVGDTMAKVVLDFLSNPNKEAGSIDTLLFISKDMSEYSCLSTDTIVYVLKEPSILTTKVSPAKVYCKDRLPRLDTITVEIQGAISYANCRLRRGYDDTNAVDFHIMRYPMDSLYGSVLKDTFIVNMRDENDTAAWIIYVVDSCSHPVDGSENLSRQTTTIRNYTTLSTQTSATISDDYVCEGDSVVLSCPESYSYHWTSSPADSTLVRDGQDTTRSPHINPYNNTSYYITVYSEDGCMARDTVSVRVERMIKAEMTYKPEEPKYSKPQIAYSDISTGVHTSKWYFGDGDSSEVVQGYHSYLVNDQDSATMYLITLIVANAAGCADTTTDTVVLVPDFTLYIPTAFQPGSNKGEGISKFTPSGMLLENYDLTIYSRWGTKIWEGHNEGWDGKMANGADAPQGVYVYDVMYKDGGNRPQRKSGTFTLIPNRE